MRIERAISLLKQMIATPSPSREEGRVADIIEAELRALGFEPQRKGNNVWAAAWAFDENKPTILLDGHIDTVKPNVAWVRDPFAPTVDDGRLYGLGSNDDGGSVVALLAAFARLAKTEQPYNLIFLASAEEEVTGVGGVRAVLPELGDIDFAIVGEPTSLQPAVAERGLLVLDCVAYGKSGHAAREEGENAIYKALQDIEWFRTYQFAKSSPLLGGVKMSVTGVNAGTQHNVVPDICTFVVDIRSNECYSNEELYQEICSQVQSEVKARSFRLNSSHIGIEHPFVKRTMELGRTPFGSPTLSDQALMKFPSVKIGPGKSSRSHTADEYIMISEIEEAIRMYIEILDGLVI